MSPCDRNEPNALLSLILQFFPLPSSCVSSLFIVDAVVRVSCVVEVRVLNDGCRRVLSSYCISDDAARNSSSIVKCYVQYGSFNYVDRLSCSVHFRSGDAFNSYCGCCLVHSSSTPKECPLSSFTLWLLMLRLNLCVDFWLCWVPCLSMSLFCDCRLC
jgi:hypothetical protein